MIIKSVPQFIFSNEEVAAAERIRKITEEICETTVCNNCPFNLNNHNRGGGNTDCKITISTIVNFFQDNKEE